MLIGRLGSRRRLIQSGRTNLRVGAHPRLANGRARSEGQYGAEEIRPDAGGRRRDSFRQAVDPDLDGAIEAVEAVEVDRHRQAAAARNVGILRVERYPEILLAAADHEAVEEILIRQVPNVTEADDIPAVGGDVE